METEISGLPVTGVRIGVGWWLVGVCAYVCVCLTGGVWTWSRPVGSYISSAVGCPTEHMNYFLPSPAPAFLIHETLAYLYLMKTSLNPPRKNWLVMGVEGSLDDRNFLELGHGDVYV